MKKVIALLSVLCLLLGCAAAGAESVQEDYTLSRNGCTLTIKPGMMMATEDNLVTVYPLAEGTDAASNIVWMVQETTFEGTEENRNAYISGITEQAEAELKQYEAYGIKVQSVETSETADVTLAGREGFSFTITATFSVQGEIMTTYQTYLAFPETGTYFLLTVSDAAQLEIMFTALESMVSWEQ